MHREPPTLTNKLNSFLNDIVKTTIHSCKIVMLPLAPIEADILAAKVGCMSLVLAWRAKQATRQTLAHRPLKTTDSSEKRDWLPTYLSD